MPNWSSDLVQQQLRVALGQSLSNKFDDLMAKDIQDSYIPQAWWWAIDNYIDLPEGNLDSQLAYLHIHYPEAFL